MKSFRNQFFKRKSGLPWQVIGGQALILVPHEQEAHELNDTACFIWEHLDGQNSFEQMVQFMMKAYQVEKNVAEADIEQSLQDFDRLNLVEC